MAVQDLTPQLRTRLNRAERAVGLFASLAVVLLLAAFGYYLYHTAKRKAWFLLKLPYHTFIDSGAGLKVGDPVKLMGFDAGEITEITSMPPGSTDGHVYVEFLLRDPYFGYIWNDSKVRITTGDFLGKRILDLVPGGTFQTNDLHATYKTKGGVVEGMWNGLKGTNGAYLPGSQSKGYTLEPIESPALTERFEAIANDVRSALPGILGLTNQIALTLSNANVAISKANGLLAEATPILGDVKLITSHLTEPRGSLGEWILPTNIANRLDTSLSLANAGLTNVNGLVANTDATVAKLSVSLDETIRNLAALTSNLNAQVAVNTNILAQVSSAVVSADQLMQGLQRHWLLRSAFKKKETNAPATRVKSPRGANQ